MISIMPEQATALARLLADTAAVAADIEASECMSIRVVTYHPSREDNGPPADARWFTINAIGTVREQAPTPAAQAA